MGDSGASRTLLTEKSARFFPSKDFNPHEQRMEVVYGGGDKAPIVSKVQVGELEALVVPDLQDNLVSLSDFADKGSTILLSSAGGLISNSLNDKQIVLNKDDGSWRVSLSDIEKYNHEQSSYAAFSATFAKTKLARYIALHERSCHQSAEVLIHSLEGDCPNWIRADITPQEIR